MIYRTSQTPGDVIVTWERVLSYCSRFKEHMLVEDTDFSPRSKVAKGLRT